MKRLLLGALIALVCASSAFAQTSSVLVKYPAGSRLIDGSKLNLMVNQTNSKSGICTTGLTCGTGYSVSGQGVGGAVTQATNRTTGVTLNTLSGVITTNNASLAAEAAAVFTVTNSQVGINDIPIVAIQSGSNGGNTKVTVNTVAAGSFIIQVANDNAAAGTAETGAILINFAIVKGQVN